ncbi:MAG: single-stranded DNA-binding protein [Pseudomonadota bacterium]
MTTAMLTAAGRLEGTPEHRRSSTGTDWATGCIAVPLPGDDSDTVVQRFQLVGFGKKAAELARHRDGDHVSVTGELRVRRWLQHGDERRELQLVVRQIIGPRSVSRGRRSETNETRKRPLKDNPAVAGMVALAGNSN